MSAALTGTSISRHSLEKLVESVPGMVYQFKLATDGSMSFPFVSKHAFGLYDVTSEDFQKDPALFVSRVHPQFQEEVLELIRESATKLCPFSWTGKIVTQKGVEKWIRAQSIPELQADGSILWSGIVTDQSHEKSLKDEIHKQRVIAEHQSKLASIGQLASGIGHEINNPLMILTGKVQKLKQHLEAKGWWDPDSQNIFESHASAAFRIKKIVNGLKNFSRMEDEVTSEVSDVGEVIRQTYFMISEILDNDGIVFQFDDFSGERVFAQFSAGKLQQILVNLISNSRDAMAEQSRKILRMELAPLSDSVVRIQVEDSGEGIRENLVEKVFDPFFTTKDVGKGTGLGLSLSQSIARRLGGSLELIRTGETGTLFELRIPRVLCSDDVTVVNGRVLPEQESFPSLKNLKLNCLIVDDEPEIREILRDLLESQIQGDIFEASHGLDALDFLSTPQGKLINLVLTDLSMPKMGGRKLVSEIRARLGAAAPKIYVVTGRIPDASTDPLIESGADGHLQKPFGLHAVRKMLSELAGNS